MQNPSPLRRPTPGSVGSPGFRVTEVSCYAAGGCDPPPERWSHPDGDRDTYDLDTYDTWNELNELIQYHQWNHLESLALDLRLAMSMC